jgi:uncharacterized membrane protein (DUF2068 family)
MALSSWSTRSRKAIRAVAVFEALKGLVVLAAGSGLLLLIHKDVHELAAHLVEHAHLNPAARYPHIFIDAATHLQDSRLTLLALGAAAYSLLRFVESYGLFREAAWAEMFAAATGAVYVPFELAGLIHRASWLGFAALALNVAVVSIMVVALLRRRRVNTENSV